MSSFEKLRDIIAVTLNVNPAGITETTKSDDISGAWDSLGHVNLMMALEQTFGVFLDVEDFPKLNSVPAILSYLKDQGVA
jgi:acyl carrier protein